MSDTQPSAPADVVDDDRSDWRIAFYESQRARADDIAKDEDAAVENIRKRADNWGKGALAVGSTALTAVSIGKLSDYVPDGHWLAASIVIGGLTVAVLCLIFVATRLTKVSTPIVMKTDISTMDDFTAGSRLRAAQRKRERKTVDDIYTRSARLNGKSSLHEYAVVATVIEATFTRLIDGSYAVAPLEPADRLKKFQQAVLSGFGEKYLPTPQPPPSGDAMAGYHNLITFALKHRDLAEARAELVRAEVRAVMARASTAVVRQRMVRATTSLTTCAALFAIPAAVIVALLLAQTAQSPHEQTEQLRTDQQSCVEIASAITEHGLPYRVPQCDALESAPGPRA
ncbi:hypothetical protein LV457_19270 [Mycobacterium sp. MYCO198283]|uniref:hypothetical protein n=1 Tax=Mycobacterium sp. MYCO198283 TaxID=2883505 RepID=UPI001E32D0A9|nr:hypothetical protein [Mycobacterium sp. MYCO198283]MCG5434417.1 hypothetical protein [Mycobacterium sp. MYCO198283]